MKPRNPNNSLKNGHCYLVGMSGCGKTSAIKKLLIKQDDQVVIFDPFGDYDGTLCARSVVSYSCMKKFAAALIAGRKQSKSFKIAYQPTHNTDHSDLDNFCRVCWGVGDGSNPKPLKIVLEEVAQHSENAGKAAGYHGQILRVGRKYNLHCINLFQRGQEVSKTIFGNCDSAVIMQQKTPKCCRAIADYTGIAAARIAELDKLQYIHQIGKVDKFGVIKW